MNADMRDIFQRTVLAAFGANVGFCFTAWAALQMSLTIAGFEWLCCLTVIVPTFAAAAFGPHWRRA